MEKIIVPICLFAFTSVVGWVLHLKSKADKADVEKVVDSKLIATNKEIEDLKDTCLYFKAAIASIETYNKLAEEKSKSSRESIQDTLSRHNKEFVSYTEKQQKHNEQMFSMLNSIITEQAVIIEKQNHL